MQDDDKAVPGPADWLTSRERVVLDHLVTRLTYAEIAERLYRK